MTRASDGKPGNTQTPLLTLTRVFHGSKLPLGGHERPLRVINAEQPMAWGTERCAGQGSPSVLAEASDPVEARATVHLGTSFGPGP